MPVTYTLPKCKCSRCGHEWTPRTEAVPLRCAKCKSPYWNTPRRNQNRT